MDFGPDEERSLTGSLFSKRPRGYGAAIPSVSRPTSVSTPKSFLKHEVSSTDTLQGLAIKYGTQVADIKKTNKLWNNDSLCMRTTVLIPIFDGEDCPGHSSDDPPALSDSSVPENLNNSGSQKALNNDSSSDFFAKFDRSLTAIKERVDQLRALDQEEDVLFHCGDFRNMSASNSTITSGGSSRKSKSNPDGSSNATMQSAPDWSSNENMRSTPEPVIRSNVKKKINRHQERQEEIFQL